MKNELVKDIKIDESKHSKGYDLVLMSVNTEQKITVQKVKEFLKKNKRLVGKPILIKQGEIFILYSLSQEDEWKLTYGLDASKFKNLKFSDSFNTLDDNEEKLILRLSIITARKDDLLRQQEKHSHSRIEKELELRFEQIADIERQLTTYQKSQHRDSSKNKLSLNIIKTKDGGDCALHAILGKWDKTERQLICPDIKEKREKIRAAIMSKNNKSNMKDLIESGIKELVMSGRNDIGTSTQELRKRYRQILDTEEKLASQSWLRLQAVLQQPQHQVIMDYIQKKHQLNKTTTSLHDQFHDALNQNNGELYGCILSLPSLHEAFQEYNQSQNIPFGWSGFISENVKQEYADFVGAPHNWLLPSELAIIADVFNVTVVYHPGQNSFPLILNPEKQSTIEVQFNGINHFERLESSYYKDVIILRRDEIPKETYEEIILFKGIAQDTQYFFSGKGPEQSLSEVMNLLPQDILQLKQSHWLKTPIFEQKPKKESDAELRDIIAEEIRYHFQNNTLPFLGKAINEKLIEFKDRINKDKSFFYNTIKKIAKKIMHCFYQEMADDDKQGSILTNDEIKEILDKCPKNTDHFDENHLESLIVPVFLYLHRYLPDKDLLQQFDYRDFMRFWLQMQQAKQDLDDFLESSAVQCRYLGYRLGMHLEIFELALADSNVERKQTQGFDQAINDSRKDVTQTSAVIYKFTEKSGWRLHDVRYDKIYILDSLLDPALTREELLKSPKILAKLKSQLMRHFDYFASYHEKLYVDSEKYSSVPPTETSDIKQRCSINKEEKYQKILPEQGKNPLLEFKYHDEFTKRPGSIQLAAIINKNNRGEFFAVPTLIDALASTKYRALVIWQQVSKTKLQPIHYFIPNKNSADQECHILIFYPYREVVISSIELKSKEIKTLEENDRKLYLYLQKSKKLSQQQSEILSIKVYAKGKMVNQFTGIAGDNLISAFKALHIPLPTNDIPETHLIHPQYVYQIANLCGIKPRYQLLELETTEPINCTAFNRKSISYGLEECRLGLIRLPDLKNLEENIMGILQNHPELQGLPLLIQHAQQIVFYGRTVNGEWRINKDLDVKVFSSLISGELKPSLEKTTEYVSYSLFSNKKVPGEVYKEIADKEAHIPLDNAALCYDVTETIKQRKRARWQEHYFFLSVDAIHRATYQKNYLPWLEGLLGVNLQKYFNYGLGKRGGRILSVLNQYENELLDDLIEIIEDLHQREEPKILNYSIKIWEERKEKIKQELQKEKYPHQIKLLSQEYALLEGVLCTSQDCIIIPTKTLVKDSQYWKKIKDLKQGPELDSGSQNSGDSKIDSVSVSYDEEESRIDHSKGYDFPYHEWIKIDQNERLIRAYIVWREQKPENLEEEFDRILQEIHDRLIKLIKEKYAKKIEQGERQYVTLVIDRYFKGDDGLDSERNFIKPVTQQKEQLLFRLAESFLRRSCFKEFANNWNWDALKSDFIKMKNSKRRKNSFDHDNLSHLLADQNIEEKLTFGEDDKLIPSKIYQNYSENFVSWLVEYLPKDENLGEILGYSKSNKSETEKWAQNFTRRLLSSGIEQCSFREVTDPYAGNTLLHYTLLFYKKNRNHSLQIDNLLAINQVLFARDACFSSVNAKRQHPLEFSQLLENLGEEQDHKLLTDYQLLDMGFKNLPVFSELSYLTITKYHNYLHNSCQDLSKAWYFWSIKKGKAHRLTLLRQFLNRYIPLVYTQNDTTLEIELVKVSNNQAYWPSGILGLGQGGYSSLWSQTQSVENLIRVRSSVIANIYMVMLCSEKQFKQLLYDNTQWRGEGIIYLNRPKKDKINACWLLNGLWNHLQLKPKNSLDFKNLESNGLPPFPWKRLRSPETFTINKSNEELVKQIARECGCTSNRPSQEPKLQLFRSNIAAKIDDKHLLDNSLLTTKPFAGERDDEAKTLIREGSSVAENPQQNREFEELQKCKERIEILATEVSAYRTKASETDQKIMQLESELREQNRFTTTDTTYSPRLIGQSAHPAPTETPSTVSPGLSDDADDEQDSGNLCIIS